VPTAIFAPCLEIRLGASGAKDSPRGLKCRARLLKRGGVAAPDFAGLAARIGRSRCFESKRSSPIGQVCQKRSGPISPVAYETTNMPAVRGQARRRGRPLVEFGPVFA
jgi:hypothetical protein